MNYLKQTLPIAEGEFESPKGYYLYSAQRGEEKRWEYTIWVTVPVWDLIWAPIHDSKEGAYPMNPVGRFLKSVIQQLREESQFPSTSPENFIVNKVLQGIANALDRGLYDLQKDEHP